MESYIFDRHWNPRTSTLVAASFLVLASLIVSTSLVSAQTRDFAVSSNPGALCVNPGIDARSTITVSSQGDFAGTVTLSDQASPATGVSLSSIPSSVNLTPGKSVSFDLNMHTSASTPLFVYTIFLYGLSGGVEHQATVTLTVSSGCSVGGTIVPTTFGSIGSSLLLGTAILGLVGVGSIASVVYVSRRRNGARISQSAQ